MASEESIKEWTARVGQFLSTPEGSEEFGEHIAVALDAAREEGRASAVRATQSYLGAFDCGSPPGISEGQREDRLFQLYSAHRVHVGKESALTRAHDDLAYFESNVKEPTR